MFTVCPKCMLTLAVTAGDLRMGQGYVRCGRCANVFNALLALSEEPAEDGDATSMPTPADRASQSQIAAALRQEAPAKQVEPSAPAPETAADPVGEQPLAEDSNARPSSITESAVDSEPVTESEPSIENESNFDDGTGTFETIVLEGDAITQTEEFVPEESVDQEIAELTQRLGLAAPASGHVESDDAAADHIDGIEDAAVADDATDAGGLEARPAVQTAPQRWRWVVASAALLLLLVLQAIHHWRDTLAASSVWHGLLTHTYAALGAPLDPRWDVTAYDVRQQGAVADPSDSQIIRVRLSLANRAPRAQPVPLLRLTLLDRYGKRIASSELTPEQYWPPTVPPREFLASDERVDSEVAIRDPNAVSASFELDVCLRRASGALRCAADVAPTTGLGLAAR